MKRATEPAARVTAIVSPTASRGPIAQRPRSGSSAGKTTRLAVSQVLQWLASLISLGMARIASSEILTMIGRIIAATTIMALAIEKKRRSRS